MKGTLFFCFLLIATIAKADPIEDNSFLVEEAYNQEPGIVQFINVYQREQKTKDWVYTFINEIPVISQAHQFSYEIPYRYVEGTDKTQVGDIKLNYRYEFLRNEQIVTTGRVSVTNPSGDYKNGFGSGAPGYETSIMASVKVNPSWVQHWNLGAGITPGAKDSADTKASTSKYFVGLSNIYLITDRLNFMLEVVGATESSIAAEDQVTWDSTWTASPSVRYGIDYADWQFVPGVAYAAAMGPTAGFNQLVFYLSIEGKLF